MKEIGLSGRGWGRGVHVPTATLDSPLTALFTKPPVSRFTAVLNQNMRLRMHVHAKRTEPADAKSQCRRQRSRTRSLVRKKAAVQNDLLGSFCTAALHHSLFLLDGFRT